MSGKNNIDLDINYTDPPGGLIDIDILGTDLYTIFYSLFFILISVFFIFKMSQRKIINFERSIAIFSYHSVFSALFIFLLMTKLVNDLDSYFQIGIFFPDFGYEDNYNFRQWGILTISHFYRIFHLYFQLDFLAINLLFACIGSFVLIFFDKIISSNLNLNNTKKKSLNYFFYFLVFFPSFSIWTSYLGKDILTILILLFIAHIILNEKKIVLKFSLIAPLIFLISLIRPHFAFFVLVSLFIYFFFKVINKNVYRYTIILSFLIISVILGSSLIGDKIESFNIFKIMTSFFEGAEIQRRNYVSPSEWDNISSNIFKLYFSFLFTPIFAFGSIKDIFLSVENFILIIIMAKLILNVDLRKFREINETKFFLTFFIVSSFILAMFTYQSGVYWRMKWLILPYFFIGMSLIQKSTLINVKE